MNRTHAPIHDTSPWRLGTVVILSRHESEKQKKAEFGHENESEKKKAKFRA